MHFVPTDWQVLPQVILQIDGITVNLLLDTGATTSSVNKIDFINDKCTEGSSMGINGTTVIHKVTAPLPVCTLTGELVTHMSFAVLLECPVCLLGRDLMAALQISLVFDKKGRLTATSMKCDLTNPKRRDMNGFFLSIPMSLENHPIWAKCKDSVGTINCEPYRPCLKEGVMPTFQKQYPLSEEKLEGIRPQIEKYLQMGILRKIVSPWNTPINPVKKNNGTWRFVQDLRKVNKAIIPLPPLVADLTAVFGAIPAGSKYYTVVDLSNAFFSIPVAWDAQSLFAFQWADDGQVTWTRLPQGFGDSPAAFSIVLKATLEDWEPKRGSTLIQYTDDLLLSNSELEACEIDSRSLLDHLASKGHLASKKKIQYASTQVEYLGCIIEAGERKISPARVKAVTSLSRPGDKATMLSFLGSIVYCRQWIPDCSHWDSILRKTTLTEAPKVVEWTEDRVEAFERLIRSLTQAPALALADYGKPFQLYCVVSGETYAAVLTQTHGGRNRPVSYLSRKLPPVVLGMPHCLQALAAAAMSVKDVTKIVHGNVMELFTTHTVLSLLQNMTTQHMTAQRLSGYETILLSTANLVIKTCPDTSPVIRFLHTLLRLKCEGSDEQVDPTPEHRCDEVILSCTTPRKDLKDTPQTDSIDVFVDGSCTRPDDRTYQTGYAVVMLPNQVIEAEPIVTTSAQQAELVALTRACEIFAGHKVNIYTDSSYAFGTVHDYALIWKNRGYISADGKQIANQKYIDHLLRAIQLPEAISVIKVKGHSAKGDYQAMGNNLADRAAKMAAKRDTRRESKLLFMTDFESENWVSVVYQLQKQSTSEDIKYWKSQGLQMTGTDPTHPFLPGDKVLVKQLAVRHKTGPIYQGPFEVLRVARTAVLTDQSPQWIHASRLKKTPEGVLKEFPGQA
ncbi:uncharacterized protein LOC122932604 [Bufo gargarizans]|uniref:uncharacterized protein LOC122932604 n=2 Tax=Bufo gargarizans TaxID=30331 RepID=UPI001CF48FD7|nr:uncharacterized protein LOC122932604 [Bufo gargarizans]